MHEEVVDSGDDHETRENEIHRVKARCPNNGAQAERGQANTEVHEQEHGGDTGAHLRGRNRAHGDGLAGGAEGAEAQTGAGARDHQHDVIGGEAHDQQGHDKGGQAEVHYGIITLMVLDTAQKEAHDEHRDRIADKEEPCAGGQVFLAGVGVEVGHHAGVGDAD